MKYIRSQKAERAGHSHIFHLSEREKVTLLATLKLYPMLDSEYHQLSRKPKTMNRGAQEWLEEEMAQQREEHQDKLEQFFGNERRFFKHGREDLHLTLTGEQTEWLLRVLNEIRVGSWVRLGRPELDAAHKVKLNSSRARLFTLMELSGYFETALLEAFS